MDINTFTFGIYSNEDVLNTSVVEINKASFKRESGALYDTKMGPFLCSGDEADEDGSSCSSQEECVTCNENIKNCPGHFGHIVLTAPVILHYKECIGFARVICHQCGHYLPETKLESALRRLPPPHIKCQNCDFLQPIVRLTPTLTDQTVISLKYKSGEEIQLNNLDYIINLFDKLSNAQLRRIGANVTHPRNLIMKYFMVLPSCCRPPNKVNGSIVHDDLTLLLSYIVKKNNKLASAKYNSEQWQVYYQALKTNILCYMDNSKGKAVHVTSNKGLLGIKERLSKKSGLLRQNLMGKRRNYTARSVVGPEPTLLLDQVGVPEKIADTLTLEEHVTPYNLEHIKQLKANGLLKRVIDKDGNECFTIDVGRKIERSLRDGDVVVLNRQPTLHRNSMLGMRVKVLPSKTIRVNLAITTGFNMDFDGDEGNLYLPRNQLAQAEVRELMSPYNNILSNRSNGVEVLLVQDSVLALFLMSSTNHKIDQMLIDTCCLHADRPPTGIKYAKDLFTLMFPIDFCWERDGVIIVDGRLLDHSKPVTKKTLSGGCNSIIRTLALEYGEHIAGTFIDIAQFIATEWLRMYPFSVGFVDCLGTYNTKAVDNIYEQHKKWLKESKDESETITVLESIKNECMMVASHNKTFMTVMMDAGSKGDAFNSMQISMLLGQQYIEGQRVQKEIDNGYRSLPHYKLVNMDNVDAMYESGGFVKSSFVDGLNPRELFFHAKSGREGMISTSQMTGVTGYAERRMVKFGEDLKIATDMSVRDANNNVVQYIYAGHGMDSSKCWKDGYPVNFKRVSNIIDKMCDIYCPDIKSMLESANRIADALETIFSKTLVCESVVAKHRQILCSNAIKYPCYNPTLWEQTVLRSYMQALASPGWAVGVVCAQAFGAKQTQNTLNIFHKAGGLGDTNSIKFGEILNLSKKINKRLVYVRFQQKLGYSQLKDHIGLAFYRGEAMEFFKHYDGKNTYTFDRKKLFEKRVPFSHLIENIVKKHTTCCKVTYVDKYSIEIIPDICSIDLPIDYLNGVYVGNAPTFPASYNLVYDKEEWVAVVNGCSLLYVLGIPNVNAKTTTCNNVWDVFDALGLIAAKQFLMKSLQECLGPEIHKSHVRLLVDKMTFSGTPMAVDRYTMRVCETGPLSRATFEESLDILIGTALRGEKDNNKGIGACLVAGKKLPIGTSTGKLISSVL
ncbi:DNA-directed RNA polymerase II subunit [Scale drop disease virus]|uniref:DNA-directed RNA polymerase subunit n=1 Tax=Scale drop disease virus TaxID=1697349 RepID=A0A0K1L691_9VIRU|nr:ORF_076L [Scale drop disease virus]AKU37491.1 ORF_076L [Scale drop disease virus]QLI60751.1 DNA-directed RNA polymerase II subunit [Scale drop disease virus]QXJ13669.1 ORF076L [Scale drop disease virus]UNH60704.1 DNA-directed RNA polymerase II subunit [Scale drop disease virus]